jgi:hypothetical protein
MGWRKIETDDRPLCIMRICLFIAVEAINKWTSPERNPGTSGKTGTSSYLPKKTLKSDDDLFTFRYTIAMSAVFSRFIFPTSGFSHATSKKNITEGFYGWQCLTNKEHDFCLEKFNSCCDALTPSCTPQCHGRCFKEYNFPLKVS